MKQTAVLALLVVSLFVGSGCSTTRGTYGLMKPDRPSTAFWGSITRS